MASEPSATAPREETDEALFGAYLDGDREAFAALVRRWTPGLRSVLGRSVPAPEVDELVQEVFLLLHRSAGDFRRGSPVRPWILTIAFNLRRDHARRANRRRARIEAHPLEAAEPVCQPPTVERAQEQQRIRAALDALSPDQRKVIELRWFSDLSYPEIAGRIGGTAGAVKVRAYRACERLRAVLGDEPEIAGSLG